MEQKMRPKSTIGVGDQTSIDVGRAALRLAITETRDKEKEMRAELLKKGIKSAAVDFGGQFVSSISKILEHVAIAAEREGIVTDSHVGKGAVVGATHQALEQLNMKCMGLNVGGKVGIARHNEHLSVAIYLGVGVIYLNEIAVAVAHRSLPIDA